MFFDGFGINFDDFWCLGDRLEISGFSMASEGGPGAEATWPVRGNLAGPWAPLQ